MIDKIGDRLIELRKIKSVSQEEIADKIGVTRQAISKWERGEGLPDLYNAVNLARFFNVSLDELITGDRLEQIDEVKGLEIKRKSNKLRIIAVTIFPIACLIGILGPRMYRDLMLYLGEPKDSYLTLFGMNIIVAVSVLIFMIGIAIVTKAYFMHREFRQLNGWDNFRW